MIKLQRDPLPAPLEQRLADQSAKLKEHLARSEEPPSALLNYYRNPDLKAHLLSEASGKCIYCESKITHVYFGDVEHIRPKSRFPAERLERDNLAIACALCNNAKGEFWSEDAPLLNPYIDEPEGEFLALGYIVGRRPGKDRARVTIDKLDLNRLGLVERRKERIELLQTLADQYVSAPEGTIKDLLRAELCKHAAGRSEYAFIVRAYLRGACDLQCLEAA